MKQSWKTSLALSLFAAAFFLLGEHYQWSWLPAEKWWILIFILAISLLSALLHSLGVKESDPHTLQKAFFTSLTLRMFLSLAFIGIFLWQGVSRPFHFVVLFFVLYFLFVGFEIYHLLTNLRADS
ncbi:MAG: hypothetical protein KatS3mg033_2176 [Thermonema sp.]|uniref:hypothetical protein n=1 Tax=Thermonema sp. TaxID=2231181 RepID=UPI0021DECA7D|nr:hypothetical protein [Thermonema sp.]GIV40376.1 MAG: hypothetical protein KatS3mg033_2176 [Thermonema sp.]